MLKSTKHLTNTKLIKYKNDTQDIMNEIARRMGVSPQAIQKEFLFYWQDIGIIVTHFLGHGITLKNFGHFILFVQATDRFAEELERKISKIHRIFDIYHFNVAHNPPERIPEYIRHRCFTLNEYITRIVLLNCSVNLYQDEVRAIYPRKYKAHRLYFDGFVKRLEEFYHIPLSEFPVQIDHPIQEVFVRKLQSKGVLPNPIIYKDTEVQPMRMHYLSKDSLSEVQLPFRFLDEPKP